MRVAWAEPKMTATPFIILSGAVFLGAFVSGLAGFAFSAVAGAMLLHVMPPMEAIPLMMACSIAVQATNLWALRANIVWKESLTLVIGGVLGAPLAVWLLQNADARLIKEGFGALIVIYAGTMLLRPSLKHLNQMTRNRNIMIGFGGGLVGGLTAMPGALPTIWCDLNGVPKAQQRGLVQPFIAVMQVLSLVLMFGRQQLSFNVVSEFAYSLPALIAGVSLGIFAFRKVQDTTFRRAILILLLFSGLALVV
jgi:uncharacterized membrane protein YfcA